MSGQSDYRSEKHYPSEEAAAKAKSEKGLSMVSRAIYRKLDVVRRAAAD